LISIYLAQFTLEMCVAAWNRKKSLQPDIAGVQNRSRSCRYTRKARQQWYRVVTDSRTDGRTCRLILRQLIRVGRA